MQDFTITTKPKILKVFKDQDTLALAQDSDYNIIFAHPEPYPLHQRMLSYTAKNLNTKYIDNVLESLQNTLKDNPDIQGILIKFDIEAVMMSAVLSKMDHPKIKCPSFESVFLCSNKYYQRLQEQDPIMFSYIDLSSDRWDENLPTFPFIIKPTELVLSLHQYIIKDRKTIDSLIDTLQQEIPTFELNYKYVSTKFLDLEKYPLATKSIMLCEEIIQDALQNQLGRMG